MQRGWFARRRGVAFAGTVLVVGLIGAGGCKNVQRGWPDPSAGALGYAEFCEADLGEVEDSVFDTIECEPLPGAIAVGSRFRVRVRLDEELPEEIEEARVEPASTRYLERVGTQLNALEPGRVALLARGSREIVDYMMVDLHEVDAIELDLPPTPPLDVAFDVQATPLGGGRMLGGELDYMWTSMSDGLEILSALGGTGRAELLITTEEEVTFEVTAGGHTESFTISAYPGPRRLRPGEGTDGGSDSGSGGDTESGTGTDTGTGTGTDGDTEGDADTGTESGGGQ